jgi:hypothetical protein
MLKRSVAFLTAIASDRSPAFFERTIAAFTVSIFAGLITARQYYGKSGSHTDFGMVWFAARSLLQGTNPYSLIGPGRAFDYTWPLIYPLPAALVVMPFAPFTEGVAATLFVGLSSGLLSFGMTRDGWYRMPLFISEAFLSSARLGQWSILITAGLFFPWLAVFAIAKPQTAIPVIAGSTSQKSIVFAVVGGVILFGISIVMQPHWIGFWLDNVRRAEHMEPPITRLAGLLIFLVLLRWRRPESWLVLLLASLPQSWGWYGTLALFTVPATFGESVFLAGVATIGGNIAALAMPAHPSIDGFYTWTATSVILTVYAPAVLLILRRPNEGPSPWWLAKLKEKNEKAFSLTSM